MMSVEDCRACSAIWLQRGKAQNISSRRATILLALSRSWSSLANQKDRLTAIEKRKTK
jgi:Zn-finger nucleic acid-binding protein